MRKPRKCGTPCIPSTSVEITFFILILVAIGGKVEWFSLIWGLYATYEKNMAGLFATLSLANSSAAVVSRKMKINYLFVYAVAKHVKMFQPKGSGCQSTTSKGIIKSTKTTAYYQQQVSR